MTHTVNYFGLNEVCIRSSSLQSFYELEEHKTLAKNLKKHLTNF